MVRSMYNIIDLFPLVVIYVLFYPVGTFSLCVLFHEVLDEARHSIARAYNIIYVVIFKKSKMFDRLLILRDRYL